MRCKADPTQPKSWTSVVYNLYLLRLGAAGDQAGAAVQAEARFCIGAHAEAVSGVRRRSEVLAVVAAGAAEVAAAVAVGPKRLAACVHAKTF